MYSQEFDKLTSRVFMDKELNNTNANKLSIFNNNPDLTILKPTGWTIYPPVDSERNLIPYYTYSFTKHPLFNRFDNGTLMVLMNKDSSSVIGYQLSLSFKSKPDFDYIYNNIRELYSKASGETIHRSVAQPFEVTKYLSKNKKDFVIITKGENDNQSYIHFAYNFQDYDW